MEEVANGFVTQIVERRECAHRWRQLRILQVLLEVFQAKLYPLEICLMLRRCLNKILELCTKDDSQSNYSSFCDFSHKLVLIQHQDEEVLAKGVNPGSVL